MSRNRVKVLSNPISVQRNYEMSIEGYKNIKEDRGIMSRISLKISLKIGIFFPESLISTL